MSWSIIISGHSEEPEAAADLEAKVGGVAAEAVAAARAAGLNPTSAATSPGGAIDVTQAADADDAGEVRLMPGQVEVQGQALTDGTGVSPLTPVKLLKDAVADFLLTLATVAGVGVGFDTFDLGAAVEAPTAFGLALGSALVRAVYRAALRWATSD